MNVNLRRIMAGNAAIMLAVLSDPDAMRHVGDGQIFTVDEIRRMIETTFENYERRGYGMFAVENPDNGMVIGFMGLVHTDDQEEPELRYAFRNGLWEEELVARSLAALVDMARETFPIEGIIAAIYPQRESCQRLAARVGFSLLWTRPNGVQVWRKSLRSGGNETP